VRGKVNEISSTHIRKTFEDILLFLPGECLYLSPSSAMRHEVINSMFLIIIIIGKI
jgi:hypothetical protein